MRIIFLNSYYATVGKLFYEFIEKNSSSADIFCLTEVYPEMFSRLEEMLPVFNGFYEKGVLDEKFFYGQAVFVRDEILAKKFNRINSPMDIQDKQNFAFTLPFQITFKDKDLHIMNIHGKSRPEDKLDTPARIKQSENILDFLKNKVGPKIIGGDFNLMPETKSIRMFEDAGYKNLIKDFGIINTRNRISWEKFPDEEKQYFADYVFISPEIKVNSFEVPNIEISDHLPLILDFDML